MSNLQHSRGNTPPPAEDEVIPNREGWWTRDHALIVVLVATTTLLLFLCALLIKPFFGPIAWAIALAVVANPFHRWIASKVPNPSIAAGLVVLAIAVLLVAPAIFVGHHIVQESAKALKSVQSNVDSGTWLSQIQAIPYLGKHIGAAGPEQIASQLQGIVGEMAKRLPEFLSGSAWAVLELLLTLFVLFYLFRDRQKALTTMRSFVPLSDREVSEVIRRASDTIHATIYGTLVVALVQGALGGLMFWWLGLPAPVLWGTVMALLAIVPVLGAFVVWVPAAIYLAVSGDWGKAAILTVWGGVVVGLIDNLLYPILVGKRLRLHTVPVFFSIVGGLAVFGAVGLVLGPLILALTDAILQIWRHRTAHGKPAEAAV
jgi:predicted PurR-regulated permease PerM